MTDPTRAAVDAHDMTGKPIPLADYDEAITVVSKYIVTGFTTMQPELYVQLPNILRCLRQGRELTAERGEHGDD